MIFKRCEKTFKQIVVLYLRFNIFLHGYLSSIEMIHRKNREYFRKGEHSEWTAGHQKNASTIENRG